MVQSRAKQTLTGHTTPAMQFEFVRRSILEWPTAIVMPTAANMRKTIQTHSMRPEPTALDWNRFRSTISAQKSTPSTPTPYTKPSKWWIHRQSIAWINPNWVIRMLETRSGWFQSFWHGNLLANPKIAMPMFRSPQQSIQLVRALWRFASISVLTIRCSNTMRWLRSPIWARPLDSFRRFCWKDRSKSVCACDKKRREISSRLMYWIWMHVHLQRWFWNCQRMASIWYRADLLLAT